MSNSANKRNATREAAFPAKGHAHGTSAMKRENSADKLGERDIDEKGKNKIPRFCGHQS